MSGAFSRRTEGADGEGALARWQLPEPIAPEKYDVLIVAPGDALGGLLRDSLRTTGFMLASVSSLAEALHLMQQRKFDLALVDLSVPDEDGTNFCSRLRAQSPDLGIIGVSSGNGVDDGLRALRAGADDCVSVPFRFRELVARIGAVLRRTRTAGAPAAAVLRAGDLELDLQQRSFRRGEKQIYLSPREFDLLAVLMSNPDTALTHTKLMDALWGTAARGGRIQLRAYIKALRQKIEDHPATPQYIVTQPWVGYRFCKPLHG